MFQTVVVLLQIQSQLFFFGCERVSEMLSIPYA